MKQPTPAELLQTALEVLEHVHAHCTGMYTKVKKQQLMDDIKRHLNKAK